MRLNVEFQQCIRRRAYRPGIRISCIVENAIHCEIVLLTALAVYRRTDAACSFPDRESPLLAGLDRGCAGC